MLLCFSIIVFILFNACGTSQKLLHVSTNVDELSERITISYTKSIAFFSIFIKFSLTLDNADLFFKRGNNSGAYIF